MAKPERSLFMLPPSSYLKNEEGTENSTELPRTSNPMFHSSSSSTTSPQHGNQGSSGSRRASGPLGSNSIPVSPVTAALGGVINVSSAMRNTGSFNGSHVQDVYKALGLVDMADDELKADEYYQNGQMVEQKSNRGTSQRVVVAGGGIPLPEVIEVELFRETRDTEWKEIQPESFDWAQIARKSGSAFVIRLKTLVNEGEPNAIIKIIKMRAAEEPAVDIVCKFNELSVAANSPKRYETRILFVYTEATDYNAQRFDQLMKDFLPANNFPYTTIEFLESFLARRRFANGEIQGEEALEVLRHHVRNHLPCSSLFLKLSAHYPEECFVELEALAAADSTLPMTHLGERSLHKLAVSVVNKQKTAEGSLRKAMSILKIGVEPRDWGYVAFNTLMRLAQDEDDLLRKNRGISRGPMQDSQVDLLLSLINVSNLDLLDKVALLMMAGRMPPKNVPEAADHAEVSQALRKINNICADRRDSQPARNAELEFTLDLLSLGSTSSCHLVSIILRKCVDNSAFAMGWNIASRMVSISKQVFGEVVTLCSKAYFASLKRPQAEELGDMWFKRIQWCVERHLPFLNRYPCGLALHVAAHRRDFDTCWRWFVTMREQLAFRLTGYHTSAVLKAASFEEEPDMEKIKDAYDMTPANERTTFTFIPLVRVWENSHAILKAKNLDFWERVCENIRQCLTMYQSGDNRKMEDLSGMDAREAAEMGFGAPNSAVAEAQLEKVVQKLKLWEESFDQWKKQTSNGTHIPAHMMRKKSERNRSRKNSRPAKQSNAAPPVPRVDSQSSPQLSASFLSRRFSDTAQLSAVVNSHQDQILQPPKPFIDDKTRRWSGPQEKDSIIAAASSANTNQQAPIGSGRRTADRRASERQGSRAAAIMVANRLAGLHNEQPSLALAAATALSSVSSSTAILSGASGASASNSVPVSRHGSIQYALSGTDPFMRRPSRDSSVSADKEKDKDKEIW